jgi:hypothetical protein
MVLFPAPFSPIKPVILPVDIDMDALSNAAMPPKVLEISIADKVFN